MTAPHTHRLSNAAAPELDALRDRHQQEPDSPTVRLHSDPELAAAALAAHFDGTRAAMLFLSRVIVELGQMPWPR